MKLIKIDTQEEIEAEILELEQADFKSIKKSNQFEFDWSEEKENHVFKIVEIEEEEPREIHGLISIINRPDEFRVHINLIENASQNKGKVKKIDKVAGCLLAFAAQIAFEKGYYGFTSLVPKTELIELYSNKYGFSQFGRQLAVEGREAINLIEKYL